MNELECQDEILQMMYWLRGEHLAETVTIEQLGRFFQGNGPALDGALAQLVGLGLVAADGDRYALTERGLVEAGRRFLEEFSSLLGKEDHLSCSDPNCDCQSEEFNGVCRSVDVGVRK